MATIVVALGGLVWLGFLGVAIVALRREAELLRRRLELSGTLVPTGPEVGSFLAGFADADERSFVFVSPACPSCDAVLDAVAGLPGSLRTSIVLVSDGSPGAALLRSPEVAVLGGAAGRSAFAAARVSATPFYVRVRNGLVVAKADLNSPSDLYSAVGAGVAVAGSVARQGDPT